MTYAASLQGPLPAHTRPLCLRNSTFADIVLIIMYSTTNMDSLPLLLDIYSNAFPTIEYARAFHPMPSRSSHCHVFVFAARVIPLVHEQQYGGLAPAIAQLASSDAVIGRASIRACLVEDRLHDLVETVGIGAVFYTCFPGIAALHPHAKGFLLIHDGDHGCCAFPPHHVFSSRVYAYHADLILNFWNLRHLDQRMPWLPYTYSKHSVHTPGTRWWWENPNVGIPAASCAWNMLSEAHKQALAVATGADDNVVGGYSDVFYVPMQHVQTFVDVARAMSACNVWVEIAVPTAFAVMAGLQAQAQGRSRDDVLTAWAVAAVAQGLPADDDLGVMHAYTENIEGARLWLSDRTMHSTWNAHYSHAIDYVRGCCDAIGY